MRAEAPAKMLCKLIDCLARSDGRPRPPQTGRRALCRALDQRLLIVPTARVLARLPACHDRACGAPYDALVMDAAPSDLGGSGSGKNASARLGGLVAVAARILVRQHVRVIPRVRCVY